MIIDSDSPANREAFRIHRGYSWAGCVVPKEDFIWATYLKWLTWGPEYLRRVETLRETHRRANEVAFAGRDK